MSPRTLRGRAGKFVAKLANRTVATPSPASASHRPGAPQSGIGINPGRSYVSGYPDHEIEGFAAEDGNAGIHNPSQWGSNTHPHGIEVINNGHGVNAGLIGHQLWSDVGSVVGRLHELVPVFKTSVQTAHDDLDEWGRAAIEKARLALQIKGEGLRLPHRFSHFLLGLWLTALLFGDWNVLAKGWEIMGLSDQPLIPGVHYTDELHLAALASVAALVALAHIAGVKLRLLAHQFERRRLAAKEHRQTLPKPSMFAATAVILVLTAGTVLLVGLGTIRVDYLRRTGTPVEASAFFFIQLGVFAAAIGLSYLFSHPYGRQWADATRTESEAKAKQQTSENGAVQVAGEANSLNASLGVLLAKAGHHVGVSEQDALRQGRLWSRRIVLSQPEPTGERLLPESLPTATNREGEELKRFLLGLGEIPQFEPADLSNLIERREEIRQQLRDLEAAHTSEESTEAVDTASTATSPTSSGEVPPTVPATWVPAASTNGGGPK